MELSLIVGISAGIGQTTVKLQQIKTLIGNVRIKTIRTFVDNVQRQVTFTPTRRGD